MSPPEIALGFLPIAAMMQRGDAIMGFYPQIEQTGPQRSADQRSDATHPSSDYRQPSGAGLAAALNRSARVQPLLQLRQALNASLRMHGQQALQRALHSRTAMCQPTIVPARSPWAPMPVIQRRPGQLRGLFRGPLRGVAGRRPADSGARRHAAPLAAARPEGDAGFPARRGPTGQFP